MGADERVLYEERQWTPWWITALAFAVPFAIVLVGTLAAQGSPKALPVWAGAAVGVGFALLIGGLVAAQSRRVVRVTDRALRIGSRAPILLGEIEAFRPVSGPELRKFRKELTTLDGAELGLPAAAFAPSLGEVAVGGAMLTTRHRRAGMISPPWLPSAALLLTSTGRTRVWLVGSRHADRLVEAIEQAKRSDPFDGGADEQGAERGLE